MSINHLTVKTVRAVASLHARFFVVCREATNEGFLSPCLVCHDLCSNRSFSPVTLDHTSTDRRSAPFSRHLCRTTVRLPDFSRRLGDTRHQRHYPPKSLDNVLQAAGTRQSENVAPGSQPVGVSGRHAARGHTQYGDRRHVDFASVRNRAGQRHSARPCQKSQSTPIRTGAMLGDTGCQCAEPHGQEVCTAHRIPFSSCHRQPQQTNNRTFPSARPSACDEGTARADTIRCLVYAGKVGVAAALTTNAHHWSGASRYGVVPASRCAAQARSWGAQKIRGENDSGSDPDFAGNQRQTDTVWQGAADSLALSGRAGAFSQSDTRARRVVRILRCGQAELVKSTPVAGNRNGTECRRNLATVRASLGDRTAVSQSETLVGRKQPVAAKAHCAGAVDADPFNGMDIGSATEFGGGGIVPHRSCRTLARQATANWRIGGSVAPNGIYRTCFSGWFLPEVLDIHLPGTARRSQIAGLAPPSAANSKRFKQFSLNCATDSVTQG